MSVRAAVLAALRTTVQTGDGEGLPLARYAVLHVAPARRSAEDVAGTYVLREHRFTVISVGTTTEQAEWVATRSADALVGLVLTVPGLVCGPIEAYQPTNIVRDDDRPDTDVFYTSCAYVMHAALA